MATSTHAANPDPEDEEGAFDDTPDTGGAAGPEFGAVVEGRNGWKIKEATRELYEQRVRRVWRAAANELAAEAGAVITPLGVVNHLIKRGRDEKVDPLKISTWYGYRSALLWDFSKHPDQEGYAIALRVLEECRHPAPERAVEMRAQDRKERLEKRGIPRKDLRRLLDQLGSMGRTVHWGARTQHWLLAGIATGIRPGEWEFTKWADPDRKTWLMAPIFKEKADLPGSVRQKAMISAVMDGRSPESVHKSPPRSLSMRTIPVDAVDQLIVNAHLSAIEAAKAQGVSFADYYTYCRRTIWRACDLLWGGTKSYSLNNARHQYAAEARKKLSPEEIAERMGHGNTRTARRHYAGPSEAYKGGGAMKQGSAETHQSAEISAQPAPDQPAPGDQAGADQAGAGTLT